MSANDNAMTRFLFAILQQKCLKDIDWNKVARDPILAQEITNGHAARMRYSRFKASMLGLEPQRRNRTNPNKSRVSKAKKDARGKKDNSAVKDEPPTAQVAAGPVADTRRVPSPEVKREISYGTPDPRTLVSTSGGSSKQPFTGPDLHTQLHHRLTPCSDTDTLAASPGFSASPSSDMLHSEASFDFSGNPDCGHDHMGWAPGPSYAAFAVNYGLDSYPTAGFCGHQSGDMIHSELGLSGGPMSPDGSQVVVKNEQWNSQRYQ